MNMDKTPKRYLGKGLESLLGDAAKSVITPHTSGPIKTENNSFIRIDAIELNPSQPRTEFNQEALEELAQSIKTYGLIQPITVRPRNGIGIEMSMTKRTAFTGVPSRLHSPNQRGIMYPSAMACIRRLTAMNVAKSAVSCADSIVPPMIAMPAGPSAFFAAANTGMARIPSSPGNAPI